MRKVPLLYLSGTVYAILLLWTLHYCNYIGKNADSGEDGGSEKFSLNLEENLRVIDDKKQVNGCYCQAQPSPSLAGLT